MNLIVLFEQDFVGPDAAAIRDARRLRHLLDIQRVALGDQLKVGLLNGKLGIGTVIRLNGDEIQIKVSLTSAPPPALPLSLVLALPRPKMLRRILQTISTLGVKEIFLINSYRVEKSYWQSPWLQPEEIFAQLLLGLEQAGDTQMPRVELRKRFKPFVEDELPALTKHRQALVAHPYSELPCPRQSCESTLLAIGPEGGFIDYEIEMFERQGFQGVHLGRRIMRVETAIPFLLGRLF